MSLASQIMSKRIWRDEAVLRLLAEVLTVPRSTLVLVSGHGARDKIVELTGVGPALVERRMLTDDLGLFLALRKRWKKTEWGVVTNMTADGARALDSIEP